MKGRRGSVRSSGLVMGLLLWAAIASARDLSDGWILPATWEAALAVGAPPPVSSPGLVCGTGRLFGMPELTQHALGLRFAAAGLRLRADWQVLGGAAWREQTWRLEAAGGRTTAFGVAAAYRRVETPAASPWSRAEASIVLRLRPAEGWEVVAWSDPLTLTPARETSPLAPWIRLRGTSGGLAWALQADRRRHGAPRWRCGVAGRAGRGVVLGVLGEADTGTLGLTTLWRRGRLAVRTSHLVHPALGTTHRWMILLTGGAS